ncbi:hypothetical protein [Wenyingzhuangia sp. IMCC45574]
MQEVKVSYILQHLKKWLGIILLIAIPLEIFFFPTLPNVVGCVMALISYFVFSFFLQNKYILYSPFAFLMYLSMFMYRFLPLIATLAEGNPITIGLELPYQTFIYETLLFLLSSLAFYLICKPKNRFKTTGLQSVLIDLNFFKIEPKLIWYLGIIGFAVRLYTFNQGIAEYGNVGGKFLDGLGYLLYAPTVLLFPDMMRLPEYKNKRLVWLYLLVVFVINIASNSRGKMITPIAIYGLLFFLYMIKNNIQVSEVMSPKLFILLLLFFVYGLNMLTDMSYAMLYTRGMRSDISKEELFKITVETFQNKELMNEIKISRGERENDVTHYSQGWTEKYIDNFMLNRFANIRITDETLYHANRRGFGDEEMQEDFINQLILIFPNPVLKMFGVSLSKQNFTYSRADLLSNGSLGSYLVTSHVGDGLVTFSFWYFPFQFIVSCFVFFLLNNLVIFKSGSFIYSAYGLMNIFSLFGLFKNSNGILLDIAFCLRMFWQGIVTYLIMYTIVKLFKRCIYG